MNKKKSTILVGMMIYVLMSVIDRFVYHVPDVIFIPVAIISIALIIIGVITTRGNR